MILDDLSQSARYEHLHPGFAEAFRFLKGLGADGWSTGRHDLDGDRVFALLSDARGLGRDAARLEFHRRYIDIQAVIEGRDEIGWRCLGDCIRVSEAYDAEADIGFLGDAPTVWLPLGPGAFTVLYPADAHAPLAGEGDMRKVVIKIAV